MIHLGPSSLCLYGDSGTGKTTNVGRFARYVKEKTGKSTRLVMASGGGWGPIQHYIDDGTIIAARISALSSPVATVRKLSRGFWPLPVEGDKILLKEPSPETWSKIGGYCVEDLTAIGDLLMKGLRFKGPKLGQDPSYSFTEEGEVFYGSNQTYYGFIQDMLYEIVHAFSNLPVERVMFTALEGKGEEEVTRETAYGPAVAGKKATPKVPSWVGDCLHAESYTVQRDSKPDPLTKQIPLDTIMRMYFTRHPDTKTGIHWPCKSRIPVEHQQDLRQRWPNGYLEPRMKDGQFIDGIDEYLRFADSIIEKLDQKNLPGNKS